VIAVSNSSPLIILAKLGCLDLLRNLFPRVYVSVEVHREIVLTGVDLPGSLEVRNAEWIQSRAVQSVAELAAAQQKYRLGSGELSALLLAKELRAGVVLLDDFDARRLARIFGLHVTGTVGLLEALYRKGLVPDLRTAFAGLLAHRVYIDRNLLNRRLRALGLPPL
jgi:predicted nucleic acid-binding protein